MIKTQYRMNLMNTFIHKNFREVKSWKSEGDDTCAFHPMFWDNNWKQYHMVRIYFLDGTEKLQKVMIDPKTDTLSLPPEKDKPEQKREEQPKQKQPSPTETKADADPKASITIEELKGMTQEEIQKLISDNQ